MASGLGVRFGGNKLLAPLGGQPMMGYALSATQGLFEQRLVVTRHADVAAYCQGLGVPVLLHDLPYRSDTVRLGLERMLGLTHCLFCPADQPLLRRETVMRLLACAAQEPEAIWRTAHDGRPGAPILFPAWVYPELMTLPQGKGGSAAAKNHPRQVRCLEVADGWELMDVDTIEDLRKIAQKMGC